MLTTRSQNWRLDDGHCVRFDSSLILLVFFMSGRPLQYQKLCFLAIGIYEMQSGSFLSPTSPNSPSFFRASCEHDLAKSSWHRSSLDTKSKASAMLGAALIPAV